MSGGGVYSSEHTAALRKLLVEGIARPNPMFDKFDRAYKIDQAVRRVIGESTLFNMRHYYDWQDIVQIATVFAPAIRAEFAELTHRDASGDFS